MAKKMMESHPNYLLVRIRMPMRIDFIPSRQDTSGALFFPSITYERCRLHNVHLDLQESVRLLCRLCHAPVLASLPLD